MPDRLYFTDSDDANRLIASDPTGAPHRVRPRPAGQRPEGVQRTARDQGATRRIDAATIAEADLEPVFREKPAIHRFPGSMAKRVHDLAVQVEERYEGDASRVWNDAADSAQLRANVAGLPGFGDMKVKSLAAVLAKRYGVDAAREIAPSHPTLGDVDSPQALVDYQAAKKMHKKSWESATR